MGPGAIVVNGEKIYVASQLTHEVFVFDGAEQYLAKFGHAQLTGPTGMGVSAAGLLYVSSFNNDQVVVFDLDGNYQRVVTGGGLQPGPTAWPSTRRAISTSPAH